MSYTTNFYLFSALGLAIFLIAILLIDRSGHQHITTNIRSQPEVPTTFTREVYEVAEIFICPCGGCGELPLDECVCEMDRGAIEAKTFIQQQFNQGKEKDQVIASMIQRYGYLKPEFEREYPK